ncbi:SMI1/KNR4 family protein [Photobacterium nomapromontoriensis]|uniref:SMI1/KNR4 family protein n=1 Tax=Photobacterium nomapromontoriensis TaxID=2910237 RepID=UPI003D0E610B
MEKMQDIKSLISDVWCEPLCTEILTKKIDVSIYSKLNENIPDDFLIIEDIFFEDDFENILSSFGEYLSEDNLFPFLGLLGEAIICIGFGCENRGDIFYFDFDFGCIQIGDDDLINFINKLVN